MALVTSGRRRRVTFNQLKLLLEFLNDHKESATGFNKTAQARDDSKRMWKSLAMAINSQEEGAVKDWRGWSKYWVDYKAKIKKRAATVHSSEGGADISPITEIEQKFLDFLGDGLPNQVDALTTMTKETNTIDNFKVKVGISLSSSSDTHLDPSRISKTPPNEESELSTSTETHPSRPNQSILGENRPDQDKLWSHKNRARKRRLIQDTSRCTLLEINQSRLDIEKRNHQILQQMLVALNKIADSISSR